MLNEHAKTGRAVVIGAGVMGSGIAAMLANIGWTVDLLDRAPEDGAGASDSDSRNRLAKEGLAQALAAKPPQFTLPELESRVQVGNMEDDLDRLAGADWIVEAIAEDLAVKRTLFSIISGLVGPDTIISSNTSGLSLAAMSADCPDDFRARFIGTHFFNPPRYMTPVELIPTAHTAPESLIRFAGFADRILGKRIIRAKDTPGFISTRIGMYSLARTMEIAARHALTVEETDYLTGSLLGRPKSGTFRLADIIGIDITAKIIDNLKAALPGDASYQALALPDTVIRLIARGRIGSKSGAGFYKKDENGEILSLDLESLEYRARKEPHTVGERLDSLPLGQRFQALWDSAPIRYRPFIRELLADSLGYAANVAQEVADRIVEVDDALIGGFGWEMGPFHILDKLPLVKWEGELPKLLTRRKEPGIHPFYTNEKGRHLYFDFKSNDFKELSRPADFIVLKDLKRAGAVVEEHEFGSLVDLGDGIVCLDWRTKMGSLNPMVTDLLDNARKRAEADFTGLVIAGGADPFSAGFDLAGLSRLIESRRWRDIDKIMSTLQETLQRFKHASIPIVCAVHGYTLGGGFEIALHGTALQAAFESSIGLPESNVGLIPVGGGITQCLFRAMAAAPSESSDPFPFVSRYWNNLRLARYSSSAPEAESLGYLRDRDGITIHPDRLLHDAKQRCLTLAGDFAASPVGAVLAMGEEGLARFRFEANELKAAGKISEFDESIALALARVLTGGDLIHAADVSEQHLLDLEREEFLKIAGTEESLARIRHMLETGKPLKN